ncbi:Very long-chain-fatty-acid--CoA ligase bubblegum [Eumeta japonica]|uniref:Very long-chain-fatty-acid--CoA ligase bubblegum n=1 Tax=Eumeta variegata TaxID=151549 RepID=A0A4C1SY59_EUMVA|nr:Very long-chain-fatty-acid--CoA ligase bubblegum [Eumeta japonica]
MSSDGLYNRAGPNRLKPSEVYRTSDVTQAVKLRLAKDGLGAEEPISIPAEAVLHVLENSLAEIVVVDDAKQMDKIHAIKDKLPNLKAVIQIEEPYAPYMRKEDGYYRWSEIENMNVSDVEDEYKKRLENIAINECCCLVYTWYRICHCRTLPPKLYFIYTMTSIAGCVYFADKDALKGTLVKSLQDARPQDFMVCHVFAENFKNVWLLFPLPVVALKMVASWAKGVTLALYGESKVYKSIDDAIKRANKHAISNAQKVQKFTILPHDFSIATGELGPTLKVKRNVVNKQYEDLIEKMYA